MKIAYFIFVFQNDGQSINTPFGYVFVSGDYDANIKVFFCIHSKQATLPR